MPADPDAIPTGRAQRATRATAALAPSSIRFFTSVATSLLRSPEDARELLERRHEEIADHALTLLGGLRGGAMKLGQLASFVDVELLPPEYRAIYQEKLGELRDSAPPMSFGKVREVLDDEWDEPLESLFEDFEHDAAAAASIGQVHRAVLPGGRHVAVKVQYPEIADALAADLDLAAVGIRLARAIAPGLEPEAVVEELRERILEELDYELEAQNQRAFARAYRGHPFAHVPEVVTSLSRRRVLVSDWVDGMPFAEVVELPQEQRDRVGEIVQRFFFGALHHIGRFNTDAHPGNYLLREDGSMAFLDFGSVKAIDPQRLEIATRGLQAILDGDAERYLDEIEALGYVHRRDRVDAAALLAQGRLVTDWYMRDAEVRIDPDYVAALIMAMSDPRAVDASIRQARAMKVPAEEIWMHRIQVGVVAVLGRLRASGNWHRTAREYIFGDEPSTDLGHAEWEHFGRP